MKVIIHNKYEDEVVFEVDDLNEESRKYILSQIRSRGWEDKDCWSEVNFLKANARLGKGPQVVDEHSTDMCAACDIDLGTCDTIWAAGGILYCSRECGIYDYSMMSNISKEDAEQLFNDEAEEINPQDIGIARR